LQAQGIWSAGDGDDKQRFLADLRALRDTAALEFDELAVRAHYPSDVLKEAENGPSLPGLPILAAYVRACDGDVPEWEERWRRLGIETRADPGLPVRPAGASPAALAGARAGVSVAQPDAYDPERIRAALRGSLGRSDRGGRGRTKWDETARWDADRSAETVAADLNGTPTNGNHHLSRPDDDPSDTAVTETPDVTQADAIRRDPFSAGWLADSEPASPPDSEPGWQDRAEAGPSSASPEDWFTPRESADREQAWSAADTETLSAVPDDTWFTPRDRDEGGVTQSQSTEHELTPPQSAGSRVMGFWTPATPATPVTAASEPAEVRLPGSPPGTADLGATDPAGSVPPGPVPAAPVPVQAAVAASSRTITGPALPPGPVVPPSKPRSDRLYPVRLLIVIVVAALIGSVLVLLLR
jgi:hypothetical protein